MLVTQPDRRKGVTSYEVVRASRSPQPAALGGERHGSGHARIPGLVLHVALAAFAPGLMAVPIVGAVDLGLCLGLLQFVSTFLITALYARWAWTEARSDG